MVPPERLACKLQSPELSAVTVPRDLIPSNTVTVLLASDMPLSVVKLLLEFLIASDIAGLGITPGTYTWTWGPDAYQSFTIQVVPTTPPNITITQTLANDTGFSHTDLITSDGHVTLSGTVSDIAGVASVEVFDGKAIKGVGG